MKLELTILFLLFVTTFYGQNVVIDITDKTPESEDNPAYDIRVIEPKNDTLDLVNKKI